MDIWKRQPIYWATSIYKHRIIVILTIHNLRGKPTNSEFIAMIADKIRLDKKRRA